MIALLWRRMQESLCVVDPASRGIRGAVAVLPVSALVARSAPVDRQRVRRARL